MSPRPTDVWADGWFGHREARRYAIREDSIRITEDLVLYGTGSMIVIGLVAVVTMIACPQGLWAYVARRFGLRFFPSRAAFATEVRSPHGICAS
jgi:hypothetical protein